MAEEAERARRQEDATRRVALGLDVDATKEDVQVALATRLGLWLPNGTAVLQGTPEPYKINIENPVRRPNLRRSTAHWSLIGSCMACTPYAAGY
eukprot:SAG31_NODE_4196_length_3483_cov_3.221927_2_plen_94_part_00